MTNIKNLLLKKEEHKLIFKYAQEAGEELNITVYIVGGYIRDLILKRTLKDIDLMVEKKA